MKHNRRFIALLVVLLLLAGCASTGTTSSGSAISASEKRTTLNTLLTMKEGYDKAFTVLGQQYKAGKLSEKAKDDAVKYGNVYLAAHNQATQDLLDGKRVDLKVVQKALDEFLTQAAAAKK